jgi:hypothetical protein
MQLVCKVVGFNTSQLANNVLDHTPYYFFYCSADLFFLEKVAKIKCSDKNGLLYGEEQEDSEDLHHRDEEEVQEEASGEDEEAEWEEDWEAVVAEGERAGAKMHTIGVSEVDHHPHQEQHQERDVDATDGHLPYREEEEEEEEDAEWQQQQEQHQEHMEEEGAEELWEEGSETMGGDGRRDA